MRIQPHGKDQAKAAAKRLTDLTQRGLPNIPRVPLSRSREAIARGVGFRDWHELAGTRSGAPSPLDHDVPPAERHTRRQQQAEALRAIGFSEADAIAAVEVILPSGDFDHEMNAFADLIQRSVRAGILGPDPIRAEAEWIMANHGLSRDQEGWAEEMARHRIALDGGLMAAAQRRTSVVREKTNPRTEGWFAVVDEEKTFWQGYFLNEFPEEEEEASRVKKLSSDFASQLTEPGTLIAALAGMMQGQVNYLGYLQANLCSAATEGPKGMSQVAILGWLIAQESGLRQFVVVRRKNEGGRYPDGTSRLRGLGYGRRARQDGCHA